MPDAALISIFSAGETVNLTVSRLAHYNPLLRTCELRHPLFLEGGKTFRKVMRAHVLP